MTVLGWVLSIATLVVFVLFVHAFVDDRMAKRRAAREEMRRRQEENGTA